MILRIARRWRFHVLHESLATIYTDCTNRYQGDDSAQGLARKLDSARDQADMTEEVLEEFGADLRQHAPARYAQIVESAAQYNLQAGRRLRGIKFSFRALVRRPLSIRLWTTLFLGLLGPRLIRVVGRAEPARKAYRMLSRLGSHDAE